MNPIPREKPLDSTIAFMRDPYSFIAKRCRRFASNIFETRLFLRRTICISGREAARIFYDPEYFIRAGAAPLRMRQTLLWKGTAITMDDAAHRHRKQMFISILSSERIAPLLIRTADALQGAAKGWQYKKEIVLYNELHYVLTRAVCAWAEVPLPESQLKKRTRQLSILFDYAGAVGPKHWLSIFARYQSAHWMISIIGDIRAGRIKPAPESAAYCIAWHQELNGELLTPKIAAAELLNIVRPTVAVSVYLIFLVHALHQHTQWRSKFAVNGSKEAFVQEVCRLYPFFPPVPALVRKSFDWNGYRLPAQRRVLLDLYGTNHDPSIWEAPEEFRPERFFHWHRDEYSFIPQGAGDQYTGHRCPAERMIRELMKISFDFFLHRISYTVPPQDLSIDISRLPALPKSKFIIGEVRLF